MLLLLILLGAVLFAGIAMTIGEGLWSNTISLLLIMISSLIALVGGVPLGTWGLEMAEKDDTFMWYFVFAGIWGVFSLSLIVLRIITDRISKTRMRFLPLIDKIAGPLMGIFVAVMFTSFAAQTLYYPIQAQVWDKKDMTETQLQWYGYARAPLETVKTRLYE